MFNQITWHVAAAFLSTPTLTLLQIKLVIFKFSTGYEFQISPSKTEAKLPELLSLLII
jgi:hypothetical protein